LGLLGFEPGELFAAPVEAVIREFFVGENLTLPAGKAWRNLKARIFTDINGKKLLFENDESLFQLLRSQTPSIELIRETVAVNMSVDEIHDDVHAFFEKLKGISIVT
jgi:hypothetical protein